MIQNRYLNPLKGLMGLFSLFLLTACAAERVHVEEVAENPADHIGEQVMVRGEVEESYGNRTFLIDNDEGEDLYVIAQYPLSVTQGLEGKKVEVTGTVRKFNRRDIERDLDTELERKEIGKIEEEDPVLIARQVIGDEDDFEGMGAGRNLVDEPGLEDDDVVGPENELFDPER